MVILTSAFIGGLIAIFALVIFVIIIGSTAGDVDVSWLTTILFILVGAALGAVVGIIIYFAS